MTSRVIQSLSKYNPYNLNSLKDVDIECGGINETDYDYIKSNTSQLVRYKLLIHSVRCNSIDRVSQLIKKYIDPSMFNSQILNIAIGFHHNRIVSLLLSDPRIDPTMSNNTPVLTAVASNNMSALIELMSEVEVDPSSNNALKLAVELQQPAIVSQLLIDERVEAKVSANNNKLLKSAIKSANIDLIDVLAAKTTSKLGAYKDYSFIDDINSLDLIETRYSIIETLLRHDLVNQKALNKLLDQAYTDNNNRLLELILAMAKPNRSEVLDLARKAIVGAKIDIFSLIYNFYPLISIDKSYIKLAREYGRPEIVSMLQSFPRLSKDAIKTIVAFFTR